jgi:hypothetical protein
MWKSRLSTGSSSWSLTGRSRGEAPQSLAGCCTGAETDGYPTQRLAAGVKGLGLWTPRRFRVVPLTCKNATWIYCCGTREAAAYFAIKLRAMSAARLNGRPCD